MANIKKEFQFICESPIEYHFNGEKREAYELTLKAPSTLSKNAPKLSQDIFRSLAEYSNVNKMSNEDKAKAQEELQKKKLENNSDSTDIELSADEVIKFLYASKNIDINDFRDRFMNLLLETNICLLDSSVQMTKAHLNYITYKDFNKLMGEYISNFLIP